MKSNWISTKPNLLPDFIIGGAMKCGTTTLHAMLAQHPQIFIPKEEVHFFDIDNILQHSDFNFHHNKTWIYQTMDKNPPLVWEWYQEKFKGGEHLVKGEDSTTYLASRIAAKRISVQKKAIKILFLLRQPSLRAFSNYNHLLRTGRATHSFEDTLRFNPYQVVNRSLYKEQLENYYKYIPKERIKVILFEDLIQQPEATLQDVCNFIGVDYKELPADVFTTHSNKGMAPQNRQWHIKKNRLLRNFGNIHYNNKLPFKGPMGKESNPFLARVINKIHSKINPLKPLKSSINAESKEFLDNYFYEELKGIDELVGKDILAQWFPQKAVVNLQE